VLRAQLVDWEVHSLWAFAHLSTSHGANGKQTTMGYKDISHGNSNLPSVADKVLKGLLYSLLLMAHADRDESASRLLDAILSHEDTITRALGQSLSTLDKADLIRLLRNLYQMQFQEFGEQEPNGLQ
jgi:hypothetical protein